MVYANIQRTFKDWKEFSKIRFTESQDCTGGHPMSIEKRQKNGRILTSSLLPNRLWISSKSRATSYLIHSLAAHPLGRRWIINDRSLTASCSTSLQRNPQLETYFHQLPPNT